VHIYNANGMNYKLNARHYLMTVTMKSSEPTNKYQAYYEDGPERLIFNAPIYMKKDTDELLFREIK